MKKLLISVIIFALCFSSQIYAEELPQEAKIAIEPRASHVFASVSSTISKTGYGGGCDLVDYGSGTLTIRLQKYASASGSWVTIAGPYSKSFSNTLICAYSKSKSLTTAGKYRCRTSVTAKVGSYSDSRTVYSGTLTIN